MLELVAGIGAKKAANPALRRAMHAALPAIGTRFQAAISTTLSEEKVIRVSGFTEKAHMRGTRSNATSTRSASVDPTPPRRR